MEIVESCVPAVAIQLDFLKPFEAPQHRAVHVEPRGRRHDRHLGSWTASPCRKIMHVFIDMDRMVGKDFEAGLANLKRRREHERGQAPARSRKSDVPEDAPCDS